MRILVIGQKGQLGTELMKAPWPSGVHVQSVGQEDLDLSQLDAVERFIAGDASDVVVNAAAYTAVDKAESEPELAFVINRDAPGVLAQSCASRSVPFIHVSTDYVFDGSKAEPYVEEDPIAPINTYGESKAAGEEAVRTANEQHLILRTSWLYSAHGQNFIKSMLRLASQRDELRVVNDQHGCPTSAADLAEAIVSLCGQIAAKREIQWGTYHYAGRGDTTWCGFADAVFETLQECGGRRPQLLGIPTSQYPTPARRPANSRMNCARIERTFGIQTRPWRESCNAVVKKLLAREAKVSR